MHWFLKLIIITLSILTVSCSGYYPERAKKQLWVAQPFIDLYKESDSESFIFYVIEKGEKFTVIGEGNGFYNIKTEDGLTGWISEQEILQTTGARGRPIRKIKYGIIYF